MNLADTAKLLTSISVVDNRRIDDPAVRTWAVILGDMTLDVAMEAMIRFRRENPGTWLDPGHIVQYAKAVQKEQDTARVKARALRLHDMNYEGFINPRMMQIINERWAAVHSPDAMQAVER